MAALMTESIFEDAFIQLLEESGWEYTFGGNLHRKYTDALLEDDLLQFLQTRYKQQELTSEELDTVIANLRNVSGASDYLALRNAVSLYRDGFDFVYGDQRMLPFKMQYIDFEHPERNIFRAVNQFEMHQGKANRRPDIMLFVNGIPVCIIELKNPAKINTTIRDAHTQITVRYMRDIPSLLKYCALSVISDGSNTRLASVVSGYEYYYAWKKVENEDQVGSGVKELETMVRGALSPVRLLEIVRDYVYFPDVQKDASKGFEVVCRYPQFFATRKLRDHILKHLRQVGGDGKGGTYFGATGCGKTYTMLFLARQLALRCSDSLKTPTVLLIVDREDLESQAGKIFCASKQFLSDDAIKVFDSREELCKEMTTRKSGGFYITTIQKFAESTGLLSDRKNIICLSDEAHRSQNNLGSKIQIRDGKNGMEAGAFITKGFAYYLHQALPNATYVGFTGTPIDETVHVFGDIVDTYTMMQAQADGITVPIKYDARLARVFQDDVLVAKIEEYYRLCADEGATEADIQKSKEAMSSIQVILGEPSRLKRVAKDIVEDYEKRVDNQPDQLQKAMITCADRTLAYRLLNYIYELRPEWGKEVLALDESNLSDEEKEKLHPVPFVNMVATRGKDDEKAMYETIGDDEHRKFLETEFKSETSNFRIAIVVDMWITGFDCPPLTILYNDKPLQKHTLIQTISRVNRTYKGKEYGFIVDYIGIRENMKQAMKRYGGQDNKDEDVEAAHNILIVEIQTLRDLLSKLNFTPFFSGTPLERLQFLEIAAEFILNNSFEKKGSVSLKSTFRGHVRRLRSAFNICNPAGVLTDEESGWSQCFMGIMSYLAKISSTSLDVTSMNKAVEKMVSEAISCSGIELVFGQDLEEDIFSEKFVKELEDVKMPNTRFQLLVKMLQKAITEYGKVNKVRAELFAQMLADTIDAYNTRDKLDFANTVAAATINEVTKVVDDKVKSLTERLLDIFRGLNKDREEFKALGITFEEKAFYDILVDIRDRNKFPYADDKCITLARKIKELVDNTALYSDWLNNDNLKNKLSSDLLMLIYREGYPPVWSDDVFKRVLEQVENYKTYEKPQKQAQIIKYDFSEDSSSSRMVADDSEIVH